MNACTQNDITNIGNNNNNKEAKSLCVQRETVNREENEQTNKSGQRKLNNPCAMFEWLDEYNMHVFLHGYKGIRFV